MTADEFRAALARLGFTQASFGRWLTEHGHPAKDTARSVRRWARTGPPGETVVILRMLETPGALMGFLQKNP